MIGTGFDGAHVPETSEEATLYAEDRLTVHLTTAEQLECVKERFRVLAEEAQSLGIVSVTLLGASDPLNEECHWARVLAANAFERRALVEWMRDSLQAEE